MSSRFIDVRKLRHSLQMSQPQFATRFGFNLSTLREWEHGRRAPDAAARTLLAVILHSPDVVQQAIGSA